MPPLKPVPPAKPVDIQNKVNKDEKLPPVGDEANKDGTSKIVETPGLTKEQVAAEKAM